MNMAQMQRPQAATAQPSVPAKPLNTRVGKYLLGGLAAIGLLVGGVGGWAATTNIAGAVIAAGNIVVAGHVKKIQHPTGGVVGEILVKNGDHVAAGDVVVRLDETVTRASLSLVAKQIDEFLGRKARLETERDDAAEIVFPETLTKRASDPGVAQIIAGEKALFESRRSTRLGQKRQLDERIEQLKQEIAGITQQIEAKSSEVSLIGKELEGLEYLEERQLVPTTKMMALRREGARLAGERAQLSAAAAQAKGKIAETELQRLNVDSEAKSEVVKELREADAKLGELVERRIAAEDQLKRIEIRSPTNGIVHELAAHTVGGVVSPSDQIMLIVPEGDRLVVEAKIAPQDIDQARQHTDAMLRFSAFDQRTTPTVKGKVLGVAADLTKDTQTGLSYYVARLEIPDSEIPRLEGQKLVPGMPVEVMIQTTERSALSYFVKPLEDHFIKAFRER